MTTLPLPEPVDAPQATPPKSGLIAAVQEIDRLHEVADTAFGLGGVAYRPEAAGPGGRARSASTDNEGADVYDPVGEDNKAGLVTAYPIVLSAEETCSAIGWTQNDYEGRARRRLEAIGGKILEREFWTGEVAQLDDLDPDVYQWLAQTQAVDVTPAGGATDPKRALGIIEDVLGRTGIGTGFIHMSRKAAIMMPDRWGDGPLITWPDSVVAIGAGYNGVGPTGAPPADGEQWVYATDLCDVWLGEIRMFPETLDQAMDPRKNTISYRAERFGAASWDGNTHIAIRVTV